MLFDAVEFFRHLTEHNRLAKKYGFRFSVVSGIDDFGDTLDNLQSRTPLVCVSDTSDGQFDLANAPGLSSVKTVFMFMPHGIVEDWMEARRRCFNVMRELFRQFLSVLIRESAKLRLGGLYLEPTVHFTELDRLFFSGGACAYFNIMVGQTADLSLNPDEWTQDPIPPRLGRLDSNMPKPSTTR